MYEQLKQLINCGWWVKVQREDRDVAIFSSVKADGNLRCTPWRDSIKECEDNIGNSFKTKSQIEEYTETYDWKIIGTLHPSKLITKIPKKVKIKANAEEWCRKLGLPCHSEKEEMIGEICEVENMKGNNFVINGYYFPPQCLEPVFDEEVEELTMEQVCKELGRTVKIKKG